MYTYICVGVISFYALLWLFTNMVPRKDEIDNSVWYLKWPQLLVFALGYIGDILWNYIFSSPIHYLLDRLSGLSHEESILWPIFVEPLTRKTLYLLTLTYRLKWVKVYRRESSYTARVANYVCHRWLDSADPGHCSVDKYLAQLGSTFRFPLKAV